MCPCHSCSIAVVPASYVIALTMASRTMNNSSDGKHFLISCFNGITSISNWAWHFAIDVRQILYLVKKVCFISWTWKSLGEWMGVESSQMPFRPPMTWWYISPTWPPDVMYLPYRLLNIKFFYIIIIHADHDSTFLLFPGLREVDFSVSAFSSLSWD